MRNCRPCFWCGGKPPNREVGALALNVLRELGEEIGNEHE